MSGRKHHKTAMSVLLRLCLLPISWGHSHTPNPQPHPMADSAAKACWCSSNRLFPKASKRGLSTQMATLWRGYKAPSPLPLGPIVLSITPCTTPNPNSIAGLPPPPSTWTAITPALVEQPGPLPLPQPHGAVPNPHTPLPPDTSCV